MIKKNLIVVNLLIFSLIISNMNLYAFKDTDSQVLKAAEEFISRGLFDAFIYKYGENYFRPEGNVSRGDFLLVLSEYYMVTERLIEQNRKISEKVQRLEKKGMASADLDMVLREFQKNLDPMLKSSSVIKKLEETGAGSVLSTRQVPEDMERDILLLKEDIKRIDAMRAKTPMADLTVDPAVIREIKNALDKLNEEVSVIEKAVAKEKPGESVSFTKLEKKISEMEKENSLIDISDIKKEIAGLNKEIKKLEKDMPAKEDMAAAVELKTVKKELGILKNDMNNIVAAVSSDGEQEIDRKILSSAQVASDTFVFPFWARASIGFSALTLLFMAR